MGMILNNGFKRKRVIEAITKIEWIVDIALNDLMTNDNEAEFDSCDYTIITDIIAYSRQIAELMPSGNNNSEIDISELYIKTYNPYMIPHICKDVLKSNHIYTLSSSDIDSINIDCDHSVSRYYKLENDYCIIGLVYDLLSLLEVSDETYQDIQSRQLKALELEFEKVLMDNSTKLFHSALVSKNDVIRDRIVGMME